MWKSLSFVTPLTTCNRTPFVHPFKPSTSKQKQQQQQHTPPKHHSVTLNQSGNSNKNNNLPDGIPEFNNGFDPATHSEYTEVRAYSFTTCRNNCSLLTLLPISGGPLAFKMSVTSQQAEAIRKSITHTQQPDRANKERPSTHDLMKSILNINGNIVSKAAITHMIGDVFVARVWVKQTNDISNENKYFEIDCRPSDALILTSKSIAPLYLNWNLIKQWGVSIKNIQYEFKNGKCDIVNYHTQNKSTHSLKYDILSNKKDILSLAHLKSRLQLAIQLQRFKEANEIQKEINAICPIDKVQNDLNRAVKEQRFKDAALLMDELCKWKGKLRLWEKGEIDLQKQYYNQLLESSPPSNISGNDKSVNNNNNSNGNTNENNPNDNNTDYGNHNTFRGLGI